MSALRVNTEDVVALLDLDVAELNDRGIEHHLINLLGVGLMVHSYNVDVVAGILILESLVARVSLLAH